MIRDAERRLEELRFVMANNKYPFTANSYIQGFQDCIDLVKKK